MGARRQVGASVRVLLILAGVAVALAVTEATLRLTGWGDGYLTDPLYRRSTAPGVSYEFRPHVRGTAWGRTPVETNAFGLRGPEITQAKSPGVVRIGIFGDSVTFGQGVRSEETFAARLEADLRAEGRRVEVLNFGVPAYSVTNIVSTFVEKAGPFDLDVAILAVIRDDYGSHRNHTADEDGYPVRADTPLRPGRVKNALRGLRLSYLIRDAFLAWRSEERAACDSPTAVWDRAGKEVRRFANVAHERGTRAMYLELSWADVPELDGVLGELALPVVRMRPVLERYDTRVLMVSRSDPHPSAFQHRLIAEKLRRAMGRLMPEASMVECATPRR